MEMLKKMERNLMLEWQRLELHTVAEIKNDAIKAYYLNYDLFKKHREFLKMNADEPNRFESTTDRLQRILVKYDLDDLKKLKFR